MSAVASTALVLPDAAKAWELRAAWATGKRVALSLDESCDRQRVEGHVTRVAGSGAFVVVRGLHIPVERVLAVHSPSRLGDSTARGDGWHGRPRLVHPQGEQLPL